MRALIHLVTVCVIPLLLGMSDVNDGTTATRTIASQTEPVHSETRDTVAQSSAPTPQMQHLAKAFEGTWKTHESFAKNEFYPNGAERSGTARFALATGGTALIENVRSDGSAGKLEFMVVLWWDGTENVYKMFTCGNGGLSPCRMRGVAHWEGDKFVNEYELTIRGANHKAKDSFEQISSKSFTLVASADLFGTGMAPIITTTYTK